MQLYHEKADALLGDLAISADSVLMSWLRCLLAVILFRKVQFFLRSC